MATAPDMRSKPLCFIQNNVNCTTRANLLTWLCGFYGMEGVLEVKSVLFAVVDILKPSHTLDGMPRNIRRRILLNNNFNFHANSGMKEAMAKGIIRGRPYGRVAFSWHSSFNKYIEMLQGYDSRRCLAIKVQSGTKSIVVFNIYFPCFESSSVYRAEISSYLGFMENILNTMMILF